MLTCPSDSLPHIVFPMDEDAYPQNPLFSAPPHSEPPSLILPFTSITPSRVNDGISGSRRSSRIQGIKSQMPNKLCYLDTQSVQNLSPSKRQKESREMVQASLSKFPGVESPRVHEKQNKDGFDHSAAAPCQNTKKDRGNPQKEPNVFAAENVVGQFKSSGILDAAKLDTATCVGLAVRHTVDEPPPKAWVIGPLFQTFKSKMASFSEIVMSPVKLFKGVPPPSRDQPPMLNGCECKADETADFKSSAASVKSVEGQENGIKDDENNQQSSPSQISLCDARVEQESKTPHSRKLSFDVEPSAHSFGQAAKCAVRENENSSVPWNHGPLPHSVSEEASHSVLKPPQLSTPPEHASASYVYDALKKSSGVEEPKYKPSGRLKPQPRKQAGSRLKKVPSETPAVNKEEADPELSIKLSHMPFVRLNRTRFCDASKAQRLLSEADLLHPDDDTKTRAGDLSPQHLRNNFKNGNSETILPPSLDTEQQVNPEACLVLPSGRSKRGLNVGRHSKMSAKRKKLTADLCAEDSECQVFSTAASDCGRHRGTRPGRKGVVSVEGPVHAEQVLKLVGKKQTVSTRATKRGKSEQEMHAVVNGGAFRTQTAIDSDATLACSLSGSSTQSENTLKNSSRKAKHSASSKGVRGGVNLGEPEAGPIDSIRPETAVGITSTEQLQHERPQPVFLPMSANQQVESLQKCRNINMKPRKRKLLNQSNTSMLLNGSSISTSSAPVSVEPLEMAPLDIASSQPAQVEERPISILNQLCKRSKKECKASLGPSAQDGSPETRQCDTDRLALTKDSQTEQWLGDITTDPASAERTHLESNNTAECHLECHVKLEKMCSPLPQEKEEVSSMAGEVSPGGQQTCNPSSKQVSIFRPSTREITLKPPRTATQRRKCRVLRGRTRAGDEMPNSVTMEDADLRSSRSRASEKGFSGCLLRSYSCPEIPSLSVQDTNWTPSLQPPQQSRTHASHQHHPSHSPTTLHIHKSLRRARRHTVCSIEVEREIAPLCLRKEVYPSRRSLPCDSFQYMALSALASRFLSSPLAFLSRKVESRGAVANCSSSSHMISSCSKSPLSSTRHLPGFVQRADTSAAILDASNSGRASEGEGEQRQQSEEDDCEDTSSSSQEFEDAGLREEKSLSDSEIKVEQKHEARGKVSSIRIRKTLPKPQNNLTPMGLPKPIRLKKKDFSLEEIYTNKNFSKPPESRLETIFEVPLSRRNGSESWFGQRRIKRFLEFLEVGEARKPKKPLVGVGKPGSSSSRTRRGGFTKDEASLVTQDVDSLLCAKLDQLSLWLRHDEAIC